VWSARLSAEKLALFYGRKLRLVGFRIPILLGYIKNQVHSWSKYPPFYSWSVQDVKPKRTVSGTEQRVNLHSPRGQQPFLYVTLVSMPSAPLPQFCRANAVSTLQPKSQHFSVGLSCTCWNWQHRFAPVWIATSRGHWSEKQFFWHATDIIQ
jgi:hypothetical protein